MSSKGEYSIKRHRTHDGRLVLAICDVRFLGNVYHDEGKVLDTASDFYRGEVGGKIEMIRWVSRAQMINAVGPKCIAYLIDAGVVDKDQVSSIKNVPFIHTLL